MTGVGGVGRSGWEWSIVDDSLHHQCRVEPLHTGALLPLELVFWIGFSLPFGPVVAVARTVLILMSWTSASRAQA